MDTYIYNNRCLGFDTILLCDVRSMMSSWVSDRILLGDVFLSRLPRDVLFRVHECRSCNTFSNFPTCTYSLVLHWSLLGSPSSFLRLRSACIFSFASCVKFCAKIVNIVPVTFFKLASNIKLVAFTTLRTGRQNALIVLSIRLIFIFHKTFALKNDSHHDKAEFLSFLNNALVSCAGCISSHIYFV